MITLPAPSLFPRASACGGRGLFSAMSRADLERAIDGAVLRLHTSPTVEERREAWADLVRLHAMRTPETVERMEIERGLR